MSMIIDPYRFAAGPTFSPTDLPSLVGWWDASDTGTITGTPTVTAFENLAGVVDMSGVGAPQTDTDTQNGFNVITLDGTDDLLRLDGTATLATQPFTLSMAVKIDTRIGSDHISDAGNGGRILVSGDANWRYFAGSGIVDSGTAADTSWHVLTLIFNGASTVMRVDGIQVASGDAGSSPLSGEWQIGGGFSGSNFCALKLGESVVDDSTLAGTDLTDLETYLSDRWL